MEREAMLRQIERLKHEEKQKEEERRVQGKKLLEEAALANKEQISRKEESRHKMADEEQVRPQTPNLTPETRNLKLETPNSGPRGLGTRNPTSLIPNPKPSTANQRIADYIADKDRKEQERQEALDEEVHPPPHCPTLPLTGVPH